MSLHDQLLWLAMIHIPFAYYLCWRLSTFTANKLTAHQIEDKVRRPAAFAVIWLAITFGMFVELIHVHQLLLRSWMVTL